MEQLAEYLDEAAEIVWGPYLLIPLLLITGLFLTLRLRGIQFRRLGAGLRIGFLERRDKDGAQGDISQFQALMVQLAATVGNGNIAGVATAIFAGGPGAVFWMWVTGLVGMATKYAEGFLGVRFREVDDNGQQSGGPMTYLVNGIGGGFGKFLGVFFAVATAIAAFGIGNMVQSNSVALALDSQFGIPTVATGIALTALTAVVLFGGIRGVGRASATLVPIMAVIYVIGGIWALVLNYEAIPDALSLIFSDAFSGTAATGGFAGAAVRQAIQFGVARGMFSNEAGLGTGGIGAAAAQTTHPVRQALVGMTQTFIDTIIVCSVTALVIVTSGTWTSGADSTALSVLAFSEALPGQWGGSIVAVGSALFAYTTLLGWGYFGERSIERLMGVRAINPYRALFVVAVMVGALQEITAVWSFADVANGLMALPNLIGLLLLSGLVARETRAYLTDPLRGPNVPRP